MVAVLALAVGVMAGIDPRRLALLVAVVYAPVPALGLLAGVVWRQRRVLDSRAVVFCDGVAGELRSGATLRNAIAEAAVAVRAPGVAAVAIGPAPIREVAFAAGSQFPDIAPELNLTIPAVARSGADSADLFDEIGTLALAQNEVSREVRVASAPARATGALFVLAPSLYLLVQARSGALPALFAEAGQRVVAALGLVLFLAGLAAAVIIMWRST